MSTFGIISITLFAVFFASLLLVFFIKFLVAREKQRLVDLERLGKTHNLAAVRNSNAQQEWSRFHAFQKGANPRVLLELRSIPGSSGPKMSLIEYQYSAGLDDLNNELIVTLTMCVFSSPRLSLAPFQLRSQGKILDALGKATGHLQDIDFEEDPEFSKRILLQGESEGDVRQRFKNTTLRQTILKHWNSNLHIEGSGDALLIYRRSIHPTTLASFLKTSHSICEQFCKASSATL